MSKHEMWWTLMLDTILNCAFPTGRLPLWRLGPVPWNTKLIVLGAIRTSLEFKTFYGSDSLSYSTTIPSQLSVEIPSLATVTPQLPEVRIGRGVSSSWLSLNPSTMSYNSTYLDSTMYVACTNGFCCPLPLAGLKRSSYGPSYMIWTILYMY